MNIAMFTDTYVPQINGVVTSLLETERCLRALGHTTYIYAPRYEKNYSDPGHIYRFWAKPLPFAREHRFGIASRRRMRRDILDKRIDMIHYHSPFSAAYAARVMGRKIGIPVVQTYHTLWEEYIHCYVPFFHRKISRTIARMETKRICGKIELVISPSNQMRDVLLSYGIKTPIEVLPTGIDLAPFQAPRSEDVRALYDIPADRHILLFVGRLAKEKNVDFLLDAVQRMAARRRDFILLLAGDGDYKRQFARRAEQQGIMDLLRLPGYVARHDLVPLYQQARLLLFPSRTETQGLVAVESMAGGTPVIGLNSMGLKDVLEGNRGGFLIEDDLDAFCRQTSRLLDDTDLFRRKQAEAKTRAADFSAPAMTHRLLELYEWAAARYRHRHPAVRL